MSGQFVRARMGIGVGLLVVVPFLSCTSSPTPPESETPTISIVISPTAASIEQGSSAEVSVTVTGAGGFSGTATVTVDGLPADVTGTVADVQSSGGTTTATVTIAVGEAATAGSYSVAVRASGSGVTAVAATFVLTVTAAPAYELSAMPDQLIIEQGGERTTEVSVSRTNFTDDVTLSVEGTPSDVTTSFDVNPVAGDLAVLTIAVDGAVATGAFTLTLRGTAAGLTDRTTSVEVTVVAPGSVGYELAAAPSALTIDQGASSDVDVTLTRTNYTEEVTLALEGAPAGVTGSFSVNPVAATTSVLTIAVGAAVAAGDYALVLRGSSASLADVDFALTLTVEEAEGFGIDALAPLSVQQGASGVRSATISRTGGFTGDVTVTVTDLPAGITATVDPVTTAGSSVDVTIDVAGSVAVGNYTAMVRGNAAGLPESVQSLAISVITSSGQQVSLDFSACVADQRPVWLAYQDGTGPWTPVSGVGDTYTFNVASSTAAIAATTVPGAGTSAVIVYYASQAEMVAADLSDVCDFSESGKTVNATVAGINPANGEGATITLGEAWVDVAADGAVAIQNVPDGNVDLVGYKWSFGSATSRMILDRGLNPSDGGNIGTIDFAGASAFDPAAATITLQGGGGFGGAWFMEYATSPSAGVCHYASLDDDVFAGTQFTVGGAPPAEQQSGDFHVVSAVDGLSYVSEMFATLANRTISFGAVLPAPTVTDITGSAGYRRARFELTLPAEYRQVTAVVTDGSGDASMAMIATEGWLGGLAVSVDVPDLSGLAGWSDAWAPTNASTTNWALTSFGWTGDDCTEGAKEVSQTTLGTVG